MNTTQDTTPPATAEGAAPILPTVTLLTTEACHLCDDAHSELLTRVSRGQVSLHLVAAASALGRTLLASHRPAMFPLVLLDGDFPRPEGMRQIAEWNVERVLSDVAGG